MVQNGRISFLLREPRTNTWWKELIIVMEGTMKPYKISKLGFILVLMFLNSYIIVAIFLQSIKKCS